MSLYQVQKLLFHVNRDRRVREQFLDERERLVLEYDLTADERQAILDHGVVVPFICSGRRCP